MISQICRFFVKIFIPTRLYFRSCAFWLENKTYSWNGLGRRNLMSRCFIEALVSHGSNWLVPLTKQNSYISRKDRSLHLWNLVDPSQCCCVVCPRLYLQESHCGTTSELSLSHPLMIQQQSLQDRGCSGVHQV